MARSLALAAALAVSLLAVSGAGGAQAQTPQRGGIVVFAANEPACLNDFLVAACEQVNAGPSVSFVVFKGAFKLAPDYTLRPDLVSSVEFTRKPRFSLTYHIRPEAHWSDGDRLRFSCDRAIRTASCGSPIPGCLAPDHCPPC